MKNFAILFLSVCCSCSVVFGDVATYESSSPGDNATTRSDWLTASGVATGQFFVDFETGFSNNQNIAGVTGLFGGGLVIEDTGNGTPEAIIQSGNGSIGGSNPVGTFSLSHDEQAHLVLNFNANPVDYVGFQDIDHTGTTGIVTFFGGGTHLFSLDSTGGTGNSAEFVGFFRNDMPSITMIELNSSGDGEWGIDSIEYGLSSVPEPGPLMGLLLVAAFWARRRRLSQ